MSEMQEKFKTIVQRIFNNWSGLRLAVEHGMGGRNGQKTAIEIMDYMYEYCIRNANPTQSEIQEVLEDLMDQEFNTVFEDNSISEICFHLLNYLTLCQANKIDEIELELSKLPNVNPWLRPEVQITYKRMEGDSSSSSSDDEEDDDEMEVDQPMDGATGSSASRTNRKTDEQIDVDPGWTVVSKKRK